MTAPDAAPLPTPPSTARVVWLMTRMQLSRWTARVVAQMNRTKEKTLEEGKPAARSATPGKASGRWAVLLLMSVMLLVCGFNVSRQFVVGLGGELEHPVESITASDPTERMVQRLHARRDSPFLDPTPWHLPWPSAPNREAMVNCLGLVLAVLAVTLFFIGLGYTNKDVARVGWHMEWLWTLPASGRTLFYAQLPGLVGSDAWSWLLFGPLLAVAYAASGWGWGSVPLAVLGTAYLSLMLCSLRLLAETVLRTTLSGSGLKNAQAVFSVFALTLYFGLMYFILYPDGLHTLAFVGRQMPSALRAAPFSLPVVVAGPLTWGTAAAFVGMLVWGVAIPVASVEAAGRLVRGGLLGRGGGGAHQGVRGRTPRPAGRAPLFTGAVGKELLVLRRDRNLMVQVFLLPLLFFGFYFVAVPGVKEFALANAGAAAAVTFGFGAYTLMISAAYSFAFEGGAVWLLYTFPRRVSAVLAEKAMMWSSLALLYTLAALVGVACLKPDMAADLVLPGAFALLGVPIMGVLAAGLGAMSTDPSQSDMQRRVNPELQFLYLFIASVYAVGVGAPGVWPKVVMSTLAALAAYAVWQQVADRLPYLLDPTALPPREISLVDGLLAALAFFGLQELFSLLFLAADAPPGPALVGAFAASGFLVVLFVLAAFHSTKMKHVAAQLGLWRRDRAGRGWATAPVVGAVGGAVAAGAAAVYLLGVAEAVRRQWLPEPVVRSAVPTAGGDLVWWLAALAVAAAPVFEEFIFRGLVYSGLRRRLPVAAATVLSAAVFAMVHPPVSVVPVFGLGLAAAICYERTGLLVAPVVTHMVYNACVLLLGRLLAPGS